MKDRNLPVIDLSCPKCGNDKAYGPEYRRGVGSDDGLGEHLRRYCTRCRYMTAVPTADADTPERRRELLTAFDQRKARWQQEKDGHQDQPESSRDRDIESVRRHDTRGIRPYGWSK